MQIKKTFTLLFVCAMYPVFCNAQSIVIEDTLSNLCPKLSEVVVYVNKLPEPARYVAQHFTSIKSKSALHYQANSGEALTNSGAVFIQKSQQGGENPIISPEMREEKQKTSDTN